MIRPSLAQLHSQVNMVIKSLPQVVTHDDSLDLQLQESCDKTPDEVMAEGKN